MENFAQLAQVRKALHQQRIGRGFFMPSDHKGDGKGKGKGKEKGMWKFDPKAHREHEAWAKPRAASDDRRQQKGIVRVNKDVLKARVRCLKCGHLGHVSKDCPKGGGKGNSKGGGLTGGGKGSNYSRRASRATSRASSSLTAATL